MIAILLAPAYILINIYILIRIVKFFGAIHERLKHPIVWGVSIAVYTFFMVTPLLGFLIKVEPYHHALKGISNYWLGVLVIAIVVIAVFDIFRIIFNKTKFKNDHPNEKRYRNVGTYAFIVICLISTYGFLHSRDIKSVEYNINVNKEVTLQTKDMSNELKIVLVADTHMGYSIGYEHISELVDKINEQKPDLVVFAGDIFDNSYDALKEPEKMADRLSEIQSTYGSYGCWGNHDLPEDLLVGFTIGKKEYKKDQRFYDFLERSNITLLEDESILVDDAFYLVGRKDPFMSSKLGEQRLTSGELTKNLDKDKPIIFIDHQPSELEEIASNGVDIDLSGHTHDGQVFPGNLLTKLAWENSCGMEKIDNMYSIVTSGAGVWGPYLRLGTDSRIDVVNVNFIKTN